MNKILIAAGAINAAISVAAGAFAAHGLKNRLEARALDIFETAARYHMYHALAMILAALVVGSVPGAKTAGWLFQAGIGSSRAASTRSRSPTSKSWARSRRSAASRSSSAGSGSLSRRCAELSSHVVSAPSNR
jgi:hypothetical protein